MRATGLAVAVAAVAVAVAAVAVAALAVTAVAAAAVAAVAAVALAAVAVTAVAAVAAAALAAAVTAAVATATLLGGRRRSRIGHTTHCAEMAIRLGKTRRIPHLSRKNTIVINRGTSQRHLSTTVLIGVEGGKLLALVKTLLG